MSSAYVRLSPRRQTGIEYSLLFFKDMYNRGIFNTLGGNGVRSAITGKMLLKMPLLLPPSEEGEKIASEVNLKVSNIEFRQAKLRKKITLLQELRGSLIHEAVTGTLDVARLG